MRRALTENDISDLEDLEVQGDREIREDYGNEIVVEDNEDDGEL